MTPADRDAAVALAKKLVNAQDVSAAVAWGDPKNRDGFAYDDEIVGLARAVLALAERPTCDWQPIATAPKDGTRVLCYELSPARQWLPTPPCDVPWVYIAGMAKDGHWEVSVGCRVRPTHWQPLPAPPAPLPSCAICRRDDCGGDHPYE